jgi:two-component system, sensor histidine kinase and response regulator
LKKNSYDLVFMDIQMPDMDGLEATRAIRAREQPGVIHTPIVALTAHTMKGDRERCLAAGMDAFVTKPIDAVEFITVVETLGGDARAATVLPPEGFAPRTLEPATPGPLAGPSSPPSGA